MADANATRPINPILHELPSRVEEDGTANTTQTNKGIQMSGLQFQWSRGVRLLDHPDELNEKELRDELIRVANYASRLFSDVEAHKIATEFMRGQITK